jgi:hypothetical protein
MRVVFAIVADAATDVGNGKIDISGAGIDTLFSPGFPAATAQLTLVWRLEFAPTECGHPHQIRVELLGPDGQGIIQPLTGTAVVSKFAPEPHRPVNTNLIFNLQGVVFPNAGDYAFHILIDNIELAVVPLYLRLQPPAPDV